MTEQEKVTLIETEQRSKANGHRLNTLEGEIREIKNDQKAIYKIATSVEVIAQRVSNIEGKVDDTNKKVDAQMQAWKSTELKLSEVRSEPQRVVADNWNKIKVAIVSAICTALAGGLIAAAVAFMN